MRWLWGSADDNVNGVDAKKNCKQHTQLLWLKPLIKTKLSFLMVYSNIIKKWINFEKSKIQGQDGIRPKSLFASTATKGYINTELKFIDPSLQHPLKYNVKKRE